jgi:hypothetical protein
MVCWDREMLCHLMKAVSYCERTSAAEMSPYYPRIFRPLFASSSPSDFHDVRPNFQFRPQTPTIRDPKDLPACRLLAPLPSPLSHHFHLRQVQKREEIQAGGLPERRLGQNSV